MDSTAWDGGWAVAYAGRDAAADAADGGGADAGGRAGIFQPCTENADCASDFCRQFMHAGFVCTRNCETAADCESAGATCNNRNICRPP